MDEAAANLTAKQKDVLDEFKKRVSGIVKPEHSDDDHYLLRWLRARNYDLEEAEDMLQKHMVWRKEWDVDNIYKWQAPEVFVKYVPGGVFGHDKEGYPIYVEAMVNMDIKGLLMSAKPKDCIRFVIRMMEDMLQAMRQRSKELGRRIDKISVIADGEGFGFKQLFTPGLSDMMTKSFALMESNYPEILKCVYVINAPSIMPALYSMVKPFLREDTKKRIKVFGKEYQSTLLEDIDADQIPKHYGGTAVDPDGNEYCASKVKPGGKVPEEYFLTGAKLVDESKVTKVLVKKGSKLDLEFRAEKGSALKWVFWTDKDDIGFGVFVKTAEGELKEVEPSARIDCHKFPEDGAIECSETATYVARFDNSHSWMTGKKLNYSFEVEKQETTADFDELQVHL